MLIDRGLQHYILTELSEAYPQAVDYTDKADYGSDKYKKYVANLAYLQEHGLIKSGLFESKSIAINDFQLASPTITAKGMDFLANDGGLSAILGVVTIKFEDKQLQEILANKVMQSDLDPERKRSIVLALQELPAESIKHLTTKIVDMGWDNLDTLMRIIQSSLS